MSDFVSMKSIQMKNKLMNPDVLRAVRDGNLTMQDLQDVKSPLQEIYQKTYAYSQYPSLSDDTQNFLSQFPSADEWRKKKE